MLIGGNSLSIGGIFEGGLRNFLEIQSEENIHILNGLHVTHINKGRLRKIKLLLFKYKHE